MKTLILTFLLPAFVWAAPPTSRRRVSTVLVAMDPAAETQRAQLEGHLNEALGNYGQLELRDAEALMGLPPDEKAQASLQKGDKLLAEGRAAFLAKDDAKAEDKLRAARKELAQAAAALHTCSSLCEATALYAATLFRRGDAEEAKLILMDLLALAPTYALKPDRYAREFIALRAQVATGRTATLRGELKVLSQPAGAKVYLDGEPLGFTPATAPALPIGQHWVRLTHPGFKQQGFVVEVTPEDVKLQATLVPTEPQRALDAQLDKIAPQLARQTPVPSALAELGKTLGLANGIVGTVRTLPGSNGTELVFGYFDLRTGKKLALQKRVLQGDEYGQLRAEAARMVNLLLAQAESGPAPKVAKGADPLDQRHGTEDWSSEDQGGKTRAAEKKARKGKDPLDNVSGTEDW